MMTHYDGEFHLGQKLNFHWSKMTIFPYDHIYVAKKKVWFSKLRNIFYIYIYIKLSNKISDTWYTISWSVFHYAQLLGLKNIDFHGFSLFLLYVITPYYSYFLIQFIIVSFTQVFSKIFQKSWYLLSCCVVYRTN